MTKVSAVICDSYSLDLIREKLKKSIEAVGGWPDKVKNAKSIFINPNLLSARPPEQAVTTHPEFVRAVIKELRDIGIEKITIGDSPAGDYGWKKLWEMTGMQKIADEENVELLPFENIKRVKLNDITIPILKELDDFDAYISLPKLKTHILTKITIAVKNTYGLIPGSIKAAFHGDYPSPAVMGHFIAEVYGLLKPDFVLVDAIECMQGDGPANGTPYPSKLIFAGEDAVAIDSSACEVYDYKFNEIPSLVKCAELNHGINTPERTGDGWDHVASLKVKRSKSDFLHKIPAGIFHLFTRWLSYRPIIDRSQCIKCGACKKVCSQDAIYIDKAGNYRVNGSKCILCMCCMEACAVHAVSMGSVLRRIMSYSCK